MYCKKKGEQELSLLEQIEERRLRGELRKEVERREELELLAKAGEVLISEQKESMLKDKGRKAVFRRAWQEQIHVKQQEKQINDELLRFGSNAQ